MKPQRFNLGTSAVDERPLVGWEYNYPNIGAVRKFDNGDAVYFFHTKWNGYHRRSYTIHVDGPSKSEYVRSKYRLTVRISFKEDKIEEFDAWASTRKEVFQKIRENIKLMRRALRVIPF